jgi:hypothetical protein
MRLVGLSSTLPGLMRVDAVAAKAVYLDQRTQLQDLTEDGQKSQALVALAKAAFYVNNDADFQTLSARALEQAIELYKQDYRQRPDLRPELRRGYSDLRDIVTFAAPRNSNWVVDQIQSIQNVELKAYLLVYAAEGIAGRHREHH